MNMECHTRARASSVRKKERETGGTKEGRSKREREVGGGGGIQDIYLSRQTHVCREKGMHVATIFVVTKLFSRQIFVATNIQTSFVPTSILLCLCLSRQNTSFVATKMILVAAPANDSLALFHSTIFTDMSLMKPKGNSLFSVTGQET